MKKKILMLLVSISIIALSGCVDNTKTKTATSTQVSPTVTQPQIPNLSPVPTHDQTQNADQNGKLSYAFKTFILWVPGTSYSIDNYDSDTSTLYSSSGTLPKSTITINPDGSFIWNSAWDEKIINGKWSIGKDGLVNLLQGQEGKTWSVIESDGKTEDVFLADGSTWYSGKSVTLAN